MSVPQQHQPGLRAASRRVNELSDRVTEQRLRLAVTRAHTRDRIERVVRGPRALVAVFVAGFAVGLLPNQRRLLAIAAFGLKARSAVVRVARIARLATQSTKTKGAPEGAPLRIDAH